MLKNILFTTLLLAMVGALRAQTAVDTALAGEWVLEKMIVDVQQRDNQSHVEKYELTDVLKMYRLSPYVIRSVRFGDGRFHMDNGAGQVWGRLVESGVQEIRFIADTIPGAPSRMGGVNHPLRYGWQRSGNVLQLELPAVTYRDTALNTLVVARYVCHYTRKK